MIKRKILLIFTAITIYSTLCAQEVITTVGDFYDTGSGSISWTIGEPVIETYYNGINILTQGFQQSKLSVNAINEKNIPELKIKVFPNPTNDFLSVEVISNEQKDFEISLFDLNGKLILKQKLTDKKQTINMQSYIPATYILTVTEKTKESHPVKSGITVKKSFHKVKTFQIVKQ